MRISTNQIQLSMLDNLQRGFGEYARLDRQIASNKRILQPSDDPVGSVQLLGLKKEQAALELGADRVLATSEEGFFAAHKREFDLILNVFDVDRAAFRLAPDQRGNNGLSQCADLFTQGAGCCSLAAMHGNEGFSQRNRNLVRSESDDFAIAADNFVVAKTRRVSQFGGDAIRCFKHARVLSIFFRVLCFDTISCVCLCFRHKS